MDVSGHSSIDFPSLVELVESMRTDPESLEPILETLNASYCGVDDIKQNDASKMRKEGLILTGNPVWELRWRYIVSMEVLPKWVRTLDNVTKMDISVSSIRTVEKEVLPLNLVKLVAEVM